MEKYSAIVGHNTLAVTLYYHSYISRNTLYFIQKNMHFVIKGFKTFVMTQYNHLNSEGHTAHDMNII